MLSTCGWSSTINATPSTGRKDGIARMVAMLILRYFVHTMTTVRERTAERSNEWNSNSGLRLSILRTEQQLLTSASRRCQQHEAGCAPKVSDLAQTVSSWCPIEAFYRPDELY
ncbi:hypothetical protein AB0M48_12730 [Lentzea sp. NPDC051208]|uniref:hypothetical protein n=1 Tax=Lentzea sp. NPDC051208 TaxID=3154642 RepID=UPI00343A851F